MLIFVYGGFAAIFAPLVTITSASILLILISLYDMYAVWKSKHMISMARYQSKQKTFAGIVYPYKFKKSERLAVLGGGDIGFTLIFSGVLLLQHSLVAALIASVAAAIALGFLFWFADETKYYPAMPFLAAGCFIALGIVSLL